MLYFIVDFHLFIDMEQIENPSESGASLLNVQWDLT